MNVIIFQHTKTEPPGAIGDILTEWKVPYRTVPLHETGDVPEVAATHAVLLGGPMSANQEREYPFLAQEKTLIRRWIGHEKPVLGICLGAQLMASAFRAPVVRSVPEHGWYTLRRVGNSLRFPFPAIFPAFQLHGETFGIPPGGDLCFTGEPVRHQGFVLGNGIALQFHLEVTPPLVEEWTRDLAPAERTAIRGESPRCVPETGRLCRQLLRGFLGMV